MWLLSCLKAIFRNWRNTRKWEKISGKKWKVYFLYSFIYLSLFLISNCNISHNSYLVTTSYKTKLQNAISIYCKVRHVISHHCTSTTTFFFYFNSYFFSVINSFNVKNEIRVSRIVTWSTRGRLVARWWRCGFQIRFVIFHSIIVMIEQDEGTGSVDGCMVVKIRVQINSV